MGSRLKASNKQDHEPLVGSLRLGLSWPATLAATLRAIASVPFGLMPEGCGQWNQGANVTLGPLNLPQTRDCDLPFPCLGPLFGGVVQAPSLPPSRLTSFFFFLFCRESCACLAYWGPSLIELFFGRRLDAQQPVAVSITPEAEHGCLQGRQGLALLRQSAPLLILALLVCRVCSVLVVLRPRSFGHGLNELKRTYFVLAQPHSWGASVSSTAFVPSLSVQVNPKFLGHFTLNTTHPLSAWAGLWVLRDPPASSTFTLGHCQCLGGPLPNNFGQGLGTIEVLWW